MMTVQPPSVLLITVRLPSEEVDDADAPAPGVVVDVVWPFTVLDVVTRPSLAETDEPVVPVVVWPETMPPPAATVLPMVPADAVLAGLPGPSSLRFTTRHPFVSVVVVCAMDGAAVMAVTAITAAAPKKVRISCLPSD